MFSSSSSTEQLLLEWNLKLFAPDFMQSKAIRKSSLLKQASKLKDIEVPLSLERLFLELPDWRKQIAATTNNEQDYRRQLGYKIQNYLINQDVRDELYMHVQDMFDLMLENSNYRSNVQTGDYNDLAGDAMNAMLRVLDFKNTKAFQDNPNMPTSSIIDVLIDYDTSQPWTKFVFSFLRPKLANQTMIRNREHTKDLNRGGISQEVELDAELSDAKNTSGDVTADPRINSDEFSTSTLSNVVNNIHEAARASVQYMLKRHPGDIDSEAQLDILDNKFKPVMAFASGIDHIIQNLQYSNKPIDTNMVVNAINEFKNHMVAVLKQIPKLSNIKGGALPASYLPALDEILNKYIDAANLSDHMQATTYEDDYSVAKPNKELQKELSNIQHPADLEQIEYMLSNMRNNATPENMATISSMLDRIHKYAAADRIDKILYKMANQ